MFVMKCILGFIIRTHGSHIVSQLLVFVGGLRMSAADPREYSVSRETYQVTHL